MAITGTAGQDLSVMVIDDDAFTCTLLSDMLSSQGVSEIYTAGDGRAALASLSKLKRAPDMLICDLCMPDMDGIELMAALAKRKYAGSVVLLSGVSIEVLQVAQTLALTDGIHLLGGYEKPLHPETLAAMLYESARSAHVGGALERA